MFTGLVTDVGRIAEIEDTNGVRRLTIESRYPLDQLAMGASIMHAGVCLTLVEFGALAGKNGHGGGSWWSIDAVPETLRLTTLGELGVGARLNLEQSLKLGEELGGHLVSGHVDGVGEVISVVPEGDSKRIRISMPEPLAGFVALKGSIAVDGTSLTVAGVGKDEGVHWFEVAAIPHTLEVTTLGESAPGRRVNLEIDMLARYVARMLEFKSE
ncbi:MAG: riboflavin synthase [Hyphomonadaceae bacterium]